jgi:hypothetical protein
MGSSERENERLEGVLGTDMSCRGGNWPSDTDCLRAWGCLAEMGSDADLARGDEMRGDVGALLSVSSLSINSDSWTYLLQYPLLFVRVLVS